METRYTVRFETMAVHAAADPDPRTGAVTASIQMSTTFERAPDGTFPSGFAYIRDANPNRKALETAMAALEGGASAVAFASGMAATMTVMQTLAPGDHVVAPLDAYFGTPKLLRELFVPWGLQVSFVDMSDVAAVRAALGPRTRLVWTETPSNPTIAVTDLAATAALARSAGALLACDNTWATPFLQQPLALGADLVLHSTTKYLGGHADVVGGFVGTNDDAVSESLAFLQKSLGAVPGPFDCWLVLRGVKTLAVRLDRQCTNAAVIASFLGGQPRVEQVFYPGLPSHPGHDIAARQMRNFGGMVSFTLGSEEEAAAVVARTTVWTLAESLGGVESLIELPARMTHASTAEAPFAVPPSLIRLSVGIEAADDLVADLELALGS
jgi:cystathionine gamma-synthase